ncbi:hypothetical protein AHAS_Ahas01G0163400 [Arachis hypogaea]
MKSTDEGEMNFLKLYVLLRRSTGAGRSSQKFSRSGGWMRNLRILDSPWLVGPPVALPWHHG